MALVVVAGAAYACVDHTQPAWWVRLRYPLYYRDSIVGYGHKYHLDPALIAAVVYEESRFKANSKSSAGAIGLMQLLPSTARGIAMHTGGTKFDPRHDLYDADLNLRYGSWYLAAPAAAATPDARTRATSPSPRTTPARRTSTTGSRATPAGQRGRRCASPRRATTSRTSITCESLYRRAYGTELGSG